MRCSRKASLFLSISDVCIPSISLELRGPPRVCLLGRLREDLEADTRLFPLERRSLVLRHSASSRDVTCRLLFPCSRKKMRRRSCPQIRSTGFWDDTQGLWTGAPTLSPGHTTHSAASSNVGPQFLHFGLRLPPPRLSTLSHWQLLRGGDLKPARSHSPRQRRGEMRRAGSPPGERAVSPSPGAEVRPPRRAAS